MTFSQFARTKRESAGLSQSTVAQAMGFSHRSEISRKEAGQVEWKLSEVQILASLLRVELSELIKEFEETRKNEY